MTSPFRIITLVSILAAGIGPASTFAAGDFVFDLATASELSPPPGTVVGGDNVEQSAQLIDPDFANLITEGWLTVTVGEPLSFDPHPNYVSTTEQRAGQTTLGDEPGVLLGYQGGRPFPGELSVDDPRAGEKLIWNMRYANGQMS